MPQRESRPGPIDWPQTLLSPAPRRIHRRKRPARPEQLLLILIDASGSTLRGHGLSTAKGIVAGLLQRAYRERQRVALLSFGGGRVTPLLEPRRPPRDPEPLLNRIHGGGGTPLPAAIAAAAELLRRERLRAPGQHQALVLLTDGRCRQVLPELPADVDRPVVDLEQGAVRLGRARGLARSLAARYLSMDDCITLKPGNRDH